MNTPSLASLARRLARLQDQAARRLLDHAQLVITTCWANEDTGERKPGVTYIITDWNNGPQLERKE